MDTREDRKTTSECCSIGREQSIEELLRAKSKRHREYATKLELLADTMANARMDEVSYNTLRMELRNVAPYH